MLKRFMASTKFSPKSMRHPNAWVGHIPFARWIVREMKPKLLVELGAHTGNSYFTFCQSVEEEGLETRCFAVDTWQGDEHAGQYGNDIFESVDDYNRQNYQKFSSLLRMTFDDALGKFEDGSIDLLHIDGLHTYEAVRHDFETWLCKLAPGAVVLFHDTHVRIKDFGVWRLWEELEKAYPRNINFAHSHGLGVLQLNNPPKEKALSWLDQDADVKDELMEYFGSLSAKQLDAFALVEFTNHAHQLELVVSDLRKKLSEKDLYLSELNRRNEELNVRNDALSRNLHDRESEIIALKNSLSWRATEPLRFIKKRFKNLRG
jgi:hypothetical protein